MAATPAALDELDDATLDLIVALQLEDLNAIQEQHPHASDPTTATRMFSDELLEYQAARRLEGQESSLQETGATDASGDVERFTCASCEAAEGFLLEDVWQAPCSHYYCIACLEQLHEMAMTDVTLYPPRCCRQTMTWEDARTRMNDDLATAFDRKKQELDVPLGQRTYCSDPNCSMFIGIAHIITYVATCPTCSKITCTMCKAPSHDGDCPADDALQETLRLAGERGWQRCRHCGALVELAHGCNHITCHCGHEFCYSCEEDWKTCECPQWDEERLLTRAEGIVEREPQAVDPYAGDLHAVEPRPADPQWVPNWLIKLTQRLRDILGPQVIPEVSQRAHQVAQEVQHLRDNHNCVHEHWTYMRGRYTCEGCTFRAPVFTMMCIQCRIRVCRRCMQNRL